MKFPVIPTILVGAAVALMIGLGIWQLQRKAEKEALLAQYAAAADLPPVSWQANLPPGKPLLYRRSSVNCINVTGWRAVSGRSADGQSGYAHVARCRTGGAEGPGANVAVGWTDRPDAPVWKGGVVDGTIAPFGKEIKLVSESAVPGTRPPDQALGRGHPEQPSFLCDPVVPVRGNRGGDLPARATPQAAGWGRRSGKDRLGLGPVDFSSSFRKPIFSKSMIWLENRAIRNPGP